MSKLIHRAWDWKRTNYIPAVRERTFADEWEKEAEPNPGINSGLGTLQGLLIDRSGPGIFGRHRVIAWVTKREAMIVATIMQWLGTNCGFCWLEETLKKAGYRLVREDSKDDTARVIVEFSGNHMKVIQYFKKTMAMAPLEKMPALTGLSGPCFQRSFHYLCNVGICQKVTRGAKDRPFATLSEAGIELLQYAQFVTVENGTLQLRANMPLRWLEKTKLPFEFEESDKKPAPEPVKKVDRKERIAAIKAARDERINARKFGELSST